MKVVHIKKKILKKNLTLGNMTSPVYKYFFPRAPALLFNLQNEWLVGHFSLCILILEGSLGVLLAIYMLWTLQVTSSAFP